MDKRAKKQFVKELTDSIVRDIIDYIDFDKIPEAWDGVELRELLKDKFDNARVCSFTSKRKKEYNNIVIINNL